MTLKAQTLRPLPGCEMNAAYVILHPPVLGVDLPRNSSLSLLAHRAHVEGPISRYQMLCRVAPEPERAFIRTICTDEEGLRADEREDLYSYTPGGRPSHERIRNRVWLIAYRAEA